MARYSLPVVLLWFYSGLACANWTGVSVTLGEDSSDWKFANDIREAQIGRVALQIEEKTAAELRIGISIGHMSLRLAADTPANTRKFDAQFIGVYLRQPIRLSEHVSLHGLFSFNYHSGSGNDLIDPPQLDWNETQLQLGISLRYENFGIMPYAAYNHIDGDISDVGGTEIFELDDPVSAGLRFDYFIEPTAFVRLDFQSGAHAGGFLSFVRQY